jgi:hypothetical protein
MFGPKPTPQQVAEMANLKALPIKGMGTKVKIKTKQTFPR